MIVGGPRGVLTWLVLCGAALTTARSAHASDPATTRAAPPSTGGEVPPVPNPSPAPHTGESTSAGYDGPPLVWRWSRFSTMDYVLTGLGGAVTLATAIIPPRSKHVRGGIWFDDAVRRTLRAHSLQARYQFRDASDVGLSLAVTWPFFADALTSAWWYRGNRDVAEQMALVDLETLAVAGAIQGVSNVLVSRERPYGSQCGTSALPANAIDCEGSQHYRSFFSGHSTFSFTGAALICGQHFEHDLLGAPWDTLSCVGGYAVAAATSSFRVVSDEHYASDVILGALVGTVVGYGVPLLHYRQRAASASSGNDLRLMLVPAAGGIGVLGIF